jgi:phosphoribosylglycinamide formyltransferase-1
MKRIVILISGRGSNLQALVEAGLPVAAVISNRADAAGLKYAAGRGIASVIVPHLDYATRDAFDAALARVIDGFSPDLVVLAGFMRIFTDDFVLRYQGRMLNIHPSLLPLFPGLDPHGQALRAGAKTSGATVHFVIPETDAGPIIAQESVPVLSGDTPESLAARVLEAEHRIYPLALRRVAEGRA